jgi:hypothetical protein
MANDSEGLSRHDLEAKIVKRCWKDEAFRKEFTANPGETFVKYLEVSSAGLPKLVIHEETPGSWHIVLRPKPANASELSENDLEKIAGSSTSSCVSVTAIGAVNLFVTPAVSVSAGVTLDKGW